VDKLVQVSPIELEFKDIFYYRLICKKK